MGIEHQITSSLRARIEYHADAYDSEHLSFPGSDRDVDADTQAVTIGLSFAFYGCPALIGLSPLG